MLTSMANLLLLIVMLSHLGTPQQFTLAVNNTPVGVVLWEWNYQRAIVLGLIFHSALIVTRSMPFLLFGAIPITSYPFFRI